MIASLPIATRVARVLWAMLALQPVGTVGVTWQDAYLPTAEAIVDAAAEHPLSGDVAWTEAVLVALAYHESRFDPGAVGDHGRSFGAYQIQPANLSPGLETWQVMGDARTAAREALRLVRISARVCRGRPTGELLSQYAAGGFGCPAKGAHASRVRVSLARRVLAWLR